MKKMWYSFLGLMTMGSMAGCGVMSDAFKGAEDAIKAPPQAIMDALKLGADFLMGIVNVFLHAVLSGVLGGLFSKLGM
jgi:hypothetical protein